VEASVPHGVAPVTFRDPPVIEVALGVQFEGRITDDARTLGDFWPRIRDEYPVRPATGSWVPTGTESSNCNRIAFSSTGARPAPTPNIRGTTNYAPSSNNIWKRFLGFSAKMRPSHLPGVRLTT
jgi:hypothetical protein